MLCRSQNGPSALVPSQLLRNISFGLLYSWDAYCSSRELDINTVRDQLGHVSVNTTNYARPRSGQRKAKAIGTLRTRPNKKPSKHWSEHKGSCNLLTESLTLDQLCGGRAGASSSSCWLSERTPHNGNHNKTEPSAENIWTKHYSGQPPIWITNSDSSRIISIDSGSTLA